MRQYYVLGILLALAMLAMGLVPVRQQGALTYDWGAFGKTLNKGPKHKLTVSDAKQIVARVADEMQRLSVPVNNGWGGRMSSGLAYGRQDVGTCSWINSAVQQALVGAGFRPDQVFGVIGVGRGSEAAGVATEAEERLRTVAWLNINHIAPAIVVGNDVIVFDIWHHAFDTGSYRSMASSRWNGRDLVKWCNATNEYPGFMFSECGQLPPAGQKPMHPGTLLEEIRENQYHQRFPNLKPKPKPSNSGNSQQSSAKPPAVSHWALVGVKPVPIENQPNTRDPRRFDRGNAEGGMGTLKVSREWNDISLKPHTSSTSATWNIKPDPTYLVPGSRLTIEGSVTLSGEISSTTFGIQFHQPGFPAHVTHTSRIAVFTHDYGASGGAFKCETVVPPKTAFPSGTMVLRVIAYAGGNGAVEYTYKWIAK